MDAPTSEPLALQEKVLTQKTDFILKALAKKYFALCAEADGEDGEAAQAAQAAFLKELHLFEFEVGKAKRIRGANQRELESYAKKQSSVEQKITQTTADIAQLKKDLQQARVERKNKEEYDLIARKILELPSRQETTDNMTRLKDDIAALEAEDARELNAAADSLTRALLEVANEMQAYVVERSEMASTALEGRLAVVRQVRCDASLLIRCSKSVTRSGSD